MAKYHLCIARPTGYSMEAPDVGTWLLQFGYDMRAQIDEVSLSCYQVANPRIGMMRNMCVQHALEETQPSRTTHILFIDPDMKIDAYVKRSPTGELIGDAKPFWEMAWPFMLQHGPCVCAVPYCGRPPDRPIHCFAPNERNEVVRMTREQAHEAKGWNAVAAAGTGCMLIDMRVFNVLKPPYFVDMFIDERQVKLSRSQDVQFSLACRDAGIPIYVNFDCWAEHWQNAPVPAPHKEIERHREIILPAGPAKPDVPALRVAGEGDNAWQ